MASYNKFAQYYDILTENVDYEKLSQYYDSIIKRFGGKQGLLLDLACGTGTLSELMTKKGYDVIGVDLSYEMLSKALDKKIESGLNIQYICQDMCKLDLYGTNAVTICSLDSFNHLDGIESVKKTFKKVSLFTDNNGLFIFDMNTIYKHKSVLADNVFVFDTDKVYCIWENEYNENNIVNINLTFFEKDKNGYQRYDENFCEKAYSIEEIDKLLLDTGFEVLEHYADFTESKPDNNTQRITYVARKV